MAGFVERETHGRIAVLRLNRPESMNAIASHEDCADLIAAIEALETDDAISAAILTGSGRAFSAGGNLKAMRDRTGIGPLPIPEATRRNYRRGVQRITRVMLDTEVPLIAAINGHAIGLGLDLACLCDMRLCAESAKFAASFIKIGIVPGDGGAWTLARAVGYATAAELFLTGDTFGPQEAKAMGLVSRITPDEALIPEAMRLAERIAANAPRAVRMTKRLLREAQNLRMAEILEMSAAFQALAHETEDHREALASFFEKRPPNYTGS
jgi:2-(1,2-epoxy-1,2-dihydrophenyl)acetyl-CoA isomerase